MKLNQTKPIDFINKHKSQDKKRGKSALPDIGTYNPEPVIFTTFTKLDAIAKKKDKSVRIVFIILEL